MPRRGVMSEDLRERIAVDLGVYDIVRSDGWGAVPSRDCGRIVRRAIEIAEQAIAVQGPATGLADVPRLR
ncbi:MAG: small, acid-soluble spore protein, alpha/beta type [Firmicutes bacterium]|nr:small, acid-soluble spore protein, alpha/beta type [Bacillota bacterium]